MLLVKHITVHYGQRQVLTDVTLLVKPKEIVSLIGANGAGKTTLLRAITGLTPLSAGDVLFDDVPIRSVTFEQVPTCRMIEKGIGLVPEGRGLFSDMTVLENLEMGAYSVRDKQAIHLQKKKMFDRFPILFERREQKAGAMSGGEQQMLAIARTLMARPKLLLLDEPGLGLSPLMVKQVMDIILDINKEDGVMVLLVEQNARLALRHSHRGYVLENGKVVLSDESTLLLKNPNIQKAYLGG